MRDPSLRPLYRSSLWSPVAALSLAAAAAIVGYSVWMTIRAWSPAPWWDQWSTVAQYMRLVDGGSWLHELVLPHNEHRLVFPRLLFLIDYAWFGAANRFSLFTNLAVQAAHAALLIAIGRPGRGEEKRGFLICAAAVIALMFALPQYENFFWGFQVQFCGVFAAATAGFVLVARAAERRAARDPWVATFVAGLAMLIVATFTMANGLFAGFVAVVLVLVMRAGWRILLATAFTAVVCAALFFAGYEATNLGGEAERATDIVALLRYLVVYLGGVVGAAFRTPALQPWQLIACGGLGGLGIVLSVAAGLRTLLARGRSAADAALVAVLLFVGVTAAATASGRSADFGVEQALSSRYFTPSAVFWSAQLLYWRRALQAGPFASRFAPMASIAAVILIAAMALSQATIKPALAEWTNRIDFGSDALLSHVPDTEALAGITEDRKSIAARARFLEARHLSLFRDVRTGWRGRRLEDVVTLAPQSACSGRIQSIDMVPERERGVRSTGWIEPGDGGVARRLVVTDAAGVVRGFGSTGVAPLAAWSAPENAVGWRALADGGVGETFRVFALTDARTACEIGQRAVRSLPALGAFGEATGADIGEFLPVNASGEGVFTSNGQHPEAGPAPGPGYGSWAGDDGNLGAVFFGPFTPSQNRIAFALATGPQTGRQIVQVLDAGTGEVLRQVRPAPRRTWGWVTLEVPAGRSVVLAARDRGAGYGEWIAITSPAGVKP